MRWRILCCALALCAAAVPAKSQPPAPPQLGQEGKDVVWVPTPDRIITRMLQMADTKPGDLVVDLGSGDGRIPIAAGRDFGARGLGIEFDANLVDISIREAARQGVADRVKFLRQDLFQTELGEATVVALYVSPAVMLRLRPRLLALKPGTRVVSHQFTLGEWNPDEQAIAEGRSAYLWVVPARVDGTWRLTLQGETHLLRLTQEHQMLSGAAVVGGKPSPVFAARLRGDVIRFSLIDAHADPRAFTGRVSGDTMAGSSSAHERPALAWSARRP